MSKISFWFFLKFFHSLRRPLIEKRSLKEEARSILLEGCKDVSRLNRVSDRLQILVQNGDKEAKVLWNNLVKLKTSVFRET